MSLDTQMLMTEGRQQSIDIMSLNLHQDELSTAINTARQEDQLTRKEKQSMAKKANKKKKKENLKKINESLNYASPNDLKIENAKLREQ